MIPEMQDDQTVFAQQQPMREQAEAPVAPEPEPGQPVPSQKKSKAGKILVVSIIVFLLLIIMVLVMALMMRSNVSLLPTPTPEAQMEEQGGERSDLDRTLDQLRDDVQLADPTLNDLPFPPISFELYLQDQ